MRFTQRDRLYSLRRAIRERQQSHDGPDDADTVALDVVELIDILLAEWVVARPHLGAAADAEGDAEGHQQAVEARL